MQALVPTYVFIVLSTLLTPTMPIIQLFLHTCSVRVSVKPCKTVVKHITYLVETSVQNRCLILCLTSSCFATAAATSAPGVDAAATATAAEGEGTGARPGGHDTSDWTATAAGHSTQPQHADVRHATGLPYG